MRLTATILFTVLCQFTVAQVGKVEYTRILNFDSLTKQQIYDKALVWCTNTFKDVKSAISIKERDGGLIAGKGFQKIKYFIEKNGQLVDASILGINNYRFDWSFEIKDGKMRARIFDIYAVIVQAEWPVTDDTKSPPFNSLIRSSVRDVHWKAFKEQLEPDINTLLNDLEKNIKKNKSDW